MADERDERSEGEPKIRIVDRRMLSEEEREGKVDPSRAAGEAESAASERPKLEVIGGGTPRAAAAPKVTLDEVPAAEGEDEDDEEQLTPEEQQRLREEMENEQFALYEKELGRPLTAQEKQQAREHMEAQARSMAALEVGPMLQQLMAELSMRAAIHMGLMPNPYTKLITRNDAEARLAIDSFSALHEVLKPRLDAAAQREYARVLNDLRVNFVQITGTPAGGGGPSRIIH
jgi:hypothetical protein